MISGGVSFDYIPPCSQLPTVVEGFDHSAGQHVGSAGGWQFLEPQISVGAPVESPRGRSPDHVKLNHAAKDGKPRAGQCRPKNGGVV